MDYVPSMPYSISFPRGLYSNTQFSSPLSVHIISSCLIGLEQAPLEMKLARATVERQKPLLASPPLGPLREVTLHFDASGRSKGTATVAFYRKGDGSKAYDQYNNRLIDSGYYLSSHLSNRTVLFSMEWDVSCFITFLLQRNRGPVVSVQPACNIRIEGPHLLGRVERHFSKRVLPFVLCYSTTAELSSQSLQTLRISELITLSGSSRFEAHRRCFSIGRRELQCLVHGNGNGGSCLEKVERSHIGCFWRGDALLHSPIPGSGSFLIQRGMNIRRSTQMLINRDTS